MVNNFSYFAVTQGQTCLKTVNRCHKQSCYINKIKKVIKTNLNASEPQHLVLHFIWTQQTAAKQWICPNMLTVMMQQSAEFSSLLHVIQLYGLIFASCDDEPFAGCHGCYGCCVGMMCEVRYRCPLLNNRHKYMLAIHSMQKMAQTLMIMRVNQSKASKADKSCPQL